MERLELFGWLVDVDAAQSAAYYARSSQCGCAYCLNFVTSMEQWPSAVIEALRLIGVNPAKLGHITELEPHPDGSHDYYMICPVVGRIIAEPPDSTPKGTGNYDLWFSADPDDFPTPDDFPRPAMNVNLLARLPWLLDEEITVRDLITYRPRDAQPWWKKWLGRLRKQRP